MRRRYFPYLLTVVAPCGLAVVVGAAMAHSAWGELQLASYARSGRMALAAADRDSLAAADIVGRATGCDVAIYVNGHRRQATTGTASPQALDGAPPLARDGADGPFVRRGSGVLVGIGGAPTLAALVMPSGPPTRAVPPSSLVVASLLLLFSVLAGWIQMAGTPATRGALPATLAVALLALVPALTAWFFLMNLDDAVQSRARNLTVRDLTRSLAVANAMGITDSVTTVRALSGFDATRVRRGMVEETTLAEPADAVAKVSPPPASFTSSGSVTANGEPSIYVARRLTGGSFFVVTTPAPVGSIDAFRRKTSVIAVALALWLLTVGAAAWRWRRVSS